MKKVIVLSVMVVMLCCFAGCSQKDNTKTQDAVATDLKQYVEVGLKAISAQQDTALNRYKELCDKSSDSKKEEIVSVLNDEVIPGYQKFCDSLHTVSATTTDVQELKAVYEEGAGLQLKGLTSLSDAIAQNNSKLYEDAKEQIEKGKTKIEQHRDDMISLAEEHGITVEE